MRDISGSSEARDYEGLSARVMIIHSSLRE
jgi:hypothetical protein